MSKKNGFYRPEAYKSAQSREGLKHDAFLSAQKILDGPGARSVFTVGMEVYILDKGIKKAKIEEFVQGDDTALEQASVEFEDGSKVTLPINSLVPKPLFDGLQNDIESEQFTLDNFHRASVVRNDKLPAIDSSLLYYVEGWVGGPYKIVSISNGEEVAQGNKQAPLIVTLDVHGVQVKLSREKLFTHDELSQAKNIHL